VGSTPVAAPLTTALLVLLALLIEVLLALLACTLTLIRSRMHAVAAAIGFRTGLITVAAHGRAWPVDAGAIDVSRLMLNTSVTPD
jgi:hypothetical protein